MSDNTEFTREHGYKQTANWDLIPEHMRGGLQRYLTHGIPPGHFLGAVLKNDLAEACRRADLENLPILYRYVEFLYNYVPSSAWGSHDNYHKWIKHKGASGPNWKGY